MPIFSKLLPGSVRVAETRTELDDGPRFWQEDQYVADAVETRQQEFRTVRICARQALAEFGHGDHILVPDEHRAPEWPPNIVGSMTHAPGLRAAAVASTGEFRGIGIDAEPHQALPAEVVDVILLPVERRLAARLQAEDPGIAWDKLMFSAKESVFKTWYPLARRWLDFLECEITVGHEPGAFTARILQASPVHSGVDLSVLCGKWMNESPVGHGLLATAITVQ
ncbi:4'-phosphopantetheinyl transferase family protein [Glutamicibacter mishrai]|uniref:4'-phosphopantetheinyl transferase superfamily protein n=1 Tax=Glutamicibacter mishrai TaxID=1775880 RepID=A0A6H0SLP4_9MICC|nr:4'-phosphopantetheinyl transferase superfamily protein [Glutamicibacter mishrai]QIV88080.1 4'-phosphopantetheinyl transferase superfamily protein [Glutamicibacter mishrai]